MTDSIIGIDNAPSFDRSKLTKPDWLVKRLTHSPERAEVHELMRGLKLHTVCESAQCPNLGEC